MANKPPTLLRRSLWRIEYAAVRGAEMIFLLLPPRAALGLARVLARLYFRIGASRRRTVLENLRVAMGDRLDESQRIELARKNYEHAFTLLCEIVTRRRMVPDLRAFRRLTRFRGDLTSLAADVRLGRGGLILTAHMGNWETAGALLTYERVPFSAISRAVPNPYVQAYLMGTRDNAFDILEKRGAVQGTLDAIRAGRWVAILGDQNAGKHGVFVPFFGLPACTYPLPATLAVRHDLTVYFAVAIRRAPGHRFDVDLRRYVRPAGLDNRAAETHLLEAYHATLEEWIRANPEQYFWMHRRWKTRPEGEVPGPHLPAYDRRSGGTRRRAAPVELGTRPA